MSTINNRKTCDKGKFSSISDDDDNDNIDKKSKHGKQIKITKFFNILNQDKNIDSLQLSSSSSSSSSNIQNDQAKSNDHHNDRTLKQPSATTSYDIYGEKSQHDFRGEIMKLRSGCDTVSTNVPSTRNVRRPHRLSPAKPSVKHVPAKPKPSIKINKSTPPKKTKSTRKTKKETENKNNQDNKVDTDLDLSTVIIQKANAFDKIHKNYAKINLYVKKLAKSCDVNLEPMIQEVDDSNFSKENKTNDPPKCQEAFLPEKIDQSRYLFQKNQSIRIGQCFDKIFESTSKSKINSKKIFQNHGDPFGIVKFIYDELDKSETSQDLHSCICKFSQLIEIFVQQSRIDQIFTTTNNMFINDTGILERYINLFLNKMIQVNHSKENLLNNSAIPFIFVLLVQKIAIHNLKNSTTINSIAIELIDSIPYHFCILLQNPMIQSKSQLQSQLLAILIMGIIEIFDVFDHDLEKFAQLLETILICQVKCMDLLNQFFCWPNQNQYYEQNDDDDDENSYRIMELLLSQLYSLLSLKSVYRLHLKLGTNSSVQTKFINYGRLFKIEDYFRKLFEQVFHQFSSSDNMFCYFFQYIFRWHNSNILDKCIEKYFTDESMKANKIICVIDTFSQLMLMMPYEKCKKTGQHLHLFWLLFILIKIKNGLLKPDESIDSSRIRHNFKQAIEPIANIVWRELPYGSLYYLAHFFLAYAKNFGIDSFTIDLCKSMMNIPKIDMEFQMAIQPLVFYEYAE
ncbi:uncharacterized protein LOC113798365 isoform X2 [Dermatophagoides pteronyssinus]|uniref:uncharacterized protein LOC113798365 isoform X2 n=1 Tax=Dermatophagoides pteronyssinus TaxID=6956 RepID=UPI003F676E8F